jgi:carbonic anhydrase
MKQLFDNNRNWAGKIKARDPDFFSRLTQLQEPDYLWIGCSDSRVPANEIVGLLPGELFVHRNVANIVSHADINCLSVLQYAIDVLKIEHVIVCGHYGCGGVNAAMHGLELGLVDHWIHAIKDTYHHHQAALDAIKDDNERLDRLCELNVTAQVHNICHTNIVQDAWKRGQPLTVHGWIYGIHDGILKDLDNSYSGPEELLDIYRF